MSDFTEEDYQDFFTPFVSYEDFVLPDGRQTITFKIMSEGERVKFQQRTNRPININRKSDTASISPDVALDRTQLILTSVTGWTLMKRTQEGDWERAPFTDRALRTWLDAANPKIVSDLERAIQKANPWMQAEMTIEDIDAEIDNLRELREQRIREDAEKNS